MNTPDDPVRLHRRMPRAPLRPDPLLDELACAAAARTDCRFALIRVSDDDGAAFSGSHGIDEDWLADALDLCAALADEQSLFEVADAARHPRLRDEPLVCDEPRVRQYVGVPLRLDGRSVGALCVFDPRARLLGAGPLAALRALASAVEHWLAGRRAGARLHDDERRELDQLRREQLERRRSDRATRELVATLSHELRTPLNAVLGFTQLMQADPQLPARTQAHLGHIQTASQQLLSLVNDVLERARGEHTRQSVLLGPVPLQPVLEASLALIEAQARLRGVQIEPVRGPLDLSLRADARALGQVLLNLLSNAVKYNRDGGRAWVEVIDDGAQIGVGVCDEGKGLSTAMMQRLFRPFDRLGEETGPIAGSGLGLVISRQLVEAMHGRLEVRSVGDGGGSRFIVWLARA